MTNTPAFGGAVEQFADFGFVGVILNGFFGTYTISVAVTSYLIFRKPGIDVRHASVAAVLLLLAQFVPTFGLFFPGGLYVILILVFAAGLGIASKRRRRRASRVRIQ